MTDPPSDRVPSGTVRAAGAVLWRPGAEGPEVALVHRPAYDDWSFPKGKLKHGEHLLRAVLREVEEETGIVPRLGRRLPASHYVTDGGPKRVDYWAATAAPGVPPSGATAPGVPPAYGTGAPDGFTPNDEVDRIEWLAPAVAATRLSYERDRDVLHAFLDGPIRTTPMIIMRHGPAGDKHRWRDDDTLRPLDSRGREDAGELAGLVAGFGRFRLISSATARCVETLLPTAVAQRSELITDLAFTHDATTPATARARIHRLAGEGIPTLICTHGELIPDLVGAVCDRFGEKHPDDASLRKSGFLVFHRATGTAGTGAAGTAGTAGEGHGSAPVTGLAATERHSAGSPP